VTSKLASSFVKEKRKKRKIVVELAAPQKGLKVSSSYTGQGQRVKAEGERFPWMKEKRQMSTRPQKGQERSRRRKRRKCVAKEASLKPGNRLKPVGGCLSGGKRKTGHTDIPRLFLRMARGEKRGHPSSTAENP